MIRLQKNFYQAVPRGVVALLAVTCLVARAQETAPSNTSQTSQTKVPTSIAVDVDNSLETRFQQGLIEEEANQNLDAAIQAYREVVARLDTQRKMAATAIYRLGECYRKQGKTNEAVAQYQRVLADFSEQSVLANLSRQNLQGLNPVQTVGLAAAENQSAAVKKQQALLEEEIKLTETQLIAAQRALNNGRPEAYDQVVQAQRDILELKLKLAALPGTVDSRQKQRALLEEKGKLIESLIRDQQKRIEVGAAAPDSVIPFQRELLELQRQSAVLEAQKAAPAAANASPRSGVSASVEKQRALLDQEITLLEKQLQNDQKLVENRVLSADSLVSRQRDLLQLRRQMAALEAAPDLLEIGPVQPPSVSDEEQKEIQRLTAMLEDSPDLINGRDNGGNTPLHKAASLGQAKVAAFLLAHQADINMKNATGQTALHLAAENGYKSLVEFLLAHGASVNAKDQSGATPLLLAAGYGYKTVVQVLLAHKAAVNTGGAIVRPPFNQVYDDSTPLHYAAENATPAVLDLLLQHGADIEASNQGEETPLFKAVAADQLANAEFLLTNKAKVNIRNRAGLTPLAVAVERGNLAMAQLLLAKQANPDTADGTGRTPLHYAAMNHRVEAVALLLDNKANPNLKLNDKAPDWRGATPLHVGVFDAKITELLVTHGADVNALLPFGLSPLSRAVLDNQLPSIEILLRHGAQVNHKDDSGWTPLHYAAREGKKEAAELILAHGADVNVKNKDGDSPLHVAVRYDRRELATLLLAHKADVNAVNGHGKTPLMLIGQRAGRRFGGGTQSAPELETLLRQHGAQENTNVSELPAKP